MDMEIELLIVLMQLGWFSLTKLLFSPPASLKCAKAAKMAAKDFPFHPLRPRRLCGEAKLLALIRLADRRQGRRLVFQSTFP